MGLFDKIKANKLYEKGRSYLSSDYRPFNESASAILKEAISLGSVDAYPYLAMCCMSDDYGVKKDYAKMFEIYMQGSEKGSIVSAAAAALCYLRGIGTKQDYEKAITMCNTTIKLYNAPKRNKTASENTAFRQIRVILTICGLWGYGEEATDNKEEKFRFLESVAKEEQDRDAKTAALAEYGLAVCYHHGIAVDKDMKKALEYYENAIYKENWKWYAKDFDTIYFVGCMYLGDDDCIPDYSLAIYYLDQGIAEHPDAAEKITYAKTKLEEQENLETRINMLSGLFVSVEDEKEQEMIRRAEQSDCVEDWISLAQEYTYGNNVKKDIRKALYCVFRCVTVGKPRDMQIMIPRSIPNIAQKDLDEAKALIRGGKEFKKAARILEKLADEMDCAEAKYLLMNLSGSGQTGEKYCYLESLFEKDKGFKKKAEDARYPLAIHDIPALVFWSTIGKQEALDELERLFNRVFQIDFVTETASMGDGKFVLNKNKLNDKQMRENGLDFTLKQYQELWHILWTWSIQVHEYLAKQGNCPSMCQLGVLWSRIDFETGEGIDYERKDYWRYQAIKADYLPAKLSLADKTANGFSRNIAELEQAIEYAKEGVRYDIGGAKGLLELLEVMRSKQQQINREVAYIKQQQAEQRIAAEMEAYRKKLDDRERIFNFLAEGRMMTNEEDMYYSMLTGDHEGMENNYLWSLYREAKEKKYKEKLLREGGE